MPQLGVDLKVFGINELADGEEQQEYQQY